VTKPNTPAPATKAPKVASAHERRQTGVAMLRATAATRDVWNAILATAEKNTRRSAGYYYLSRSDVATMEELLYLVGRALLYPNDADAVKAAARVCLPAGVRVILNGPGVVEPPL
jgi:hypothetical protein